MSWIPLHLHSQYSILDATASVKGIAARAAECGMGAVALTDHGNLFGTVDFCKACAGAGVKSIIGCDFFEAPAGRLTKKRVPGQRVAHSLVLLAKDDEGTTTSAASLLLATSKASTTFPASTGKF